MKSVFNVSPPAFTKSEIADIARKHYRITGDFDELFSDRDQNFLFTTKTRRPTALPKAIRSSM